MEPEKITYIGKVDYRDKQVTFGIKEKDRTRHTYIIGKTGMGKSTMLENLAIQDIANGEGLAFIDPHGTTAEKLLDFIPEHRVHDVVYFAPFDTDHPMALNMLERVEPSKRYLVANGLMSAFKKTFTDSDGKGTFSARMEYILNNIILALLENEGQTLLGVNRMLTDKEYRKFIISNVTDPTVRDFWLVEFANYSERFAQEAAPAIQNKIGQFIANPLIRNIIGQTHTSFDIREIMDKKKILIINLSKGKVGEGNANLIGAMLITKIYLAAMSRADAGPYGLKDLPPFYFYVDEFQNFANETFADILSEARKYKLALTVAHQYVDQMTDDVKSAVFGNVGTMITFRVGATDAEIFEKEFAPVFIMDDIVNLSAYQMYLRLMIDGVGSKPFSARALAPMESLPRSFAENVIDYSRKKYGRNKNIVEQEINSWYQPIKKPEALRPPEPAMKVETKPYTPPQKEYRKEYTSPKKEYPAPQPKKEYIALKEHTPKSHVDTYHKESSKVEKPLFDDKPGMSLKDALAKALNETNKEKEQKVAKEEVNLTHTETTTTSVKETLRIKVEAPKHVPLREVPEDKLRALIYDEEK